MAYLVLIVCNYNYDPLIRKMVWIKGDTKLAKLALRYSIKKGNFGVYLKKGRTWKE